VPPPPHFHAAYQGFEALTAIETGEPMAGKLPQKAARIISEWTGQHRDALMRNWHHARQLEPLERIPGADPD